MRIFGALFSALLGYVAALLSVTARMGRRSMSAAASVESATTSATSWSDALISDAPQSQRLLLSRDGVDDRDGLAREWRASGRRAQRAIATWSQLSLDLVTLGAPPSLIAAANEDALDEIRHAKICFALARAIDARDVCGASCEITWRTTPPRGRAAALAMIAAGCLESAWSQGLSARMNTKLARRAIDRSIKAALGEIASVEARHAAHAWSVIAWCLAEDELGGLVVAHALRATQTMLPRTMGRDIPEVAAEGGWERWGIAGTALEGQETDALHGAIDRRIAKLTAVLICARQRLAAA